MRLLPAALVFGAAGAGYLYTTEELPRNLSPATWISDEGETPPDAAPAAEQLAAAPVEEIVAVAGPRQLTLEEVFRFDLTPRDVTDRWNRVSTGLGDPRYQGYRVPLVTGTTPTDLAGSLTYYFDAQPRLRRITFVGTTGHPQRVVDFVTRQFHFRRHQTGNPRVTTYRTHYRTTGLLEVTPSDVLDSTAAETNYMISLALER